MNKGNQKGITLIALIITIIVILILVAVSVSTISQSKLFDHAKDATKQWADEQEKEANISIDDDIKKYVGDDSYFVYGEYGEILLISKELDEPTTFEEAYVEYDGNKIKLTESIKNITEAEGEQKEYSRIISEDIAEKLCEKGYGEYNNDFFETTQKIILVKNGIWYTGEVVLIFK